MKKLKLTLVLLALSAVTVHLLAQELRVPQQAEAGEPATLGTSGSGKATLYLVGPGTTIKREVQLGGEISLSADELANAGRYTAVLLGKGEPVARSFYVVASKPAKLNFMARPSRVPVAHPDVISGTVLVLDRNDNLITTPTPVKFELGVNGGAINTRSVASKNGVAWTKAASGNREGAAHFTVSVGDVSEKRVVQQVASDPCNLRMKAQLDGQNLRLETEPVKDCSGNAVPDGTIVTFSESSGDHGRSTVDARVKHGIARATLPAVPGSTLSVASGVVLGNEIRWGAQ
jgi:hypothetical protein